MAVALALLLAAVAAGSLVYCILTVIAVSRYLAVAPAPFSGTEPVSILKPLSGADEGLEENLRSFFHQKYCQFEILFAVRSESDAAVELARGLQAEYPEIPTRLLITGEPPYPNAKVFSLDRMMAEARYDLLVMSDSDIRATPELLRTITGEFQDSNLGIATCPYRAVPGSSIWSRLEAIGMNTEFLGGVLVARMMEGMKFAVGPTIVARKRVIEKIGGFARLREYLAEDFVMGKFAADAGYGVSLSSYVIEHRIGTEGLRANFAHRLRWARSTRRSRPAGYVGQIFTNPLPVALILLALEPAWWPALLALAAARAAAAWAVSQRVLNDPLTRAHWWLVPVQDFLSFAFWVAGFFGNSIQWRGRRYYLYRDGKFAPLSK